MKKPLILIIANDNPAVYLEMQALWRNWIQSNRERCYCYFLKMSDTIKTAIHVDEQTDTIFVKGDESFVPGILQKTMTALEYCLHCFPDVSTIIRTNLSSIILLDKLEEPDKFTAKGYTGQHFDFSLNRYIHFISGAFICLSREIWIIILKEYLKDTKENPADGVWTRIPDDVCIGEYMGNAGVLILHAENRYWVQHQLTMTDIREILDTPEICHIRCESYRHEKTIESMRYFL